MKNFKVIILSLILLLPALVFSTAKVAFVHHGNQNITWHGNRQGGDMSSGDLAGRHDARPGFWATIDSHVYNNVAVDLHISGTLAQSYAWGEDDDYMLQGNDQYNIHGMANSYQIEIVGGAYAEHIMPYADEDMNIFALQYFKEIMTNLINPVGTANGNNTNRSKVCWVPERTWKNWLLHDFACTYGYESINGWRAPTVVLDGNTAHDWYMPGTLYQQIHQMWNGNGEQVFVAFIDYVANENMLNTSGVQNPGGWFYDHLQWLNSHSNQDLVSIYGDDWEKAAGVADWWDNTAAYDSNINWISNQGWVMAIHVSEAVEWWGVNKTAPTIDIPYTAYSYLQSWTGGNYDYWYDDSIQGWGKESFVTTESWECQGTEDPVTDFNNNSVIGDFEDLWKFGVTKLRENSKIDISNADYDYLQPGSKTAGIIKALNSSPKYPGDFGNSINQVGWITLMGMLYETAWHLGTGDEIAYWQKNLSNHTRYAGCFAYGAKWLDNLPNYSGIEIDDFDGDGYFEWAIFNDQVCAIFERKGGRAMWVFNKYGEVIVGNSMSNWGGEGDGDTGGHPGIFCDDNDNRDYSVTVINAGPGNYAEIEFSNPDGWSKRISINTGDDFLTAKYSGNPNNLRVYGGISPDLKTMLVSWYDLSKIEDRDKVGNDFIGYKNNKSKAMGIYSWNSEQSGYSGEYNGRLDSVAERISVVIPQDGEIKFFSGKSLNNLLYGDLESVRSYPNPFKPTDGNPETGSWEGGVILDKLPDGVKSCRIFNARGREIATLNKGIIFKSNEDSSYISEYKIFADGGYLLWKGKTDDNKKVASGVYIYVIESNSGIKKTGKLVVVK
ncbi:hypothetical protein KAU33_14130 [Candidatus Dependentiae bacterium]|nr:hypothetical protein [Candidatus Dependentiae bacterium]